MYALLIGGCAILGLLVGSFLNVVIYRVPRGESVISPPSACPHCGVRIRARDNLPVVSWLLLGAKCRSCRGVISWQYPLVEVVTGVVFAATAARLHASWILPSFLTFFAGLIALSWIDVERLVLPKRLVYVHLMTVGILMFAASVLTHEWRHMAVALACAVGWWFIFFVLNLINPQWLGFGDVRLSLVLGLTLGWLGYPDALLGFFAANLAGAVIGIGLIATGRIERSRRIPYGVFLSIGCAIAVFAGPSLPGPVHF